MKDPTIRKTTELKQKSEDQLNDEEKKNELTEIKGLLNC